MDLFWVTQHLAVATRPRGGDWLDVDVGRLRSAGIDVLVSCLTTAEEDALELVDESTVARRAGMTFVRTAIDDHSVPDRASVERELAALAASIRAGQRVAVHCRMGLGRSPLIAAAVLIDDGATADEAIELVSAARGVPVPETEEQRAWLKTRDALRGSSAS